MKLYLVNPVFPRSIWSLESLPAFMGARFLSTPLGLATVAALTPRHWEVEIADENVEPINFDIDADLIGIGPFNVQYARALAIAGEFRKRGKTVVFGGPYCSLNPEAFEGYGDYRICGEAENVWPEFLRDFENGTARECYRASGEKVSMEKSPVPRYDLIHGRSYSMFNIQASRGCPFQCEFCDVIVVDGRVPRFKTLEQVIAEVHQCVEQGAQHIFFADANFIGNIPYAKKLLAALAEYSRKHHYPVEFSCELTINVAHSEELLTLLQAANFVTVFIGIESPRRESLLETKKDQNVRRDILDDIQRIHSHHISVIAGMIVGFDADDHQIFQEQYDFLQELGTPFTTCGTLVALPNTPLMKRLQAEGRILNLELSHLNIAGVTDCNFVPRQMTLEELYKGYGWLLRSLYRYDSFSQRVVTLLGRFGNRKKEHRRVELRLGPILLRVLAYYLVDRERLHFFVRTFWRVARGGPFSLAKWQEFGKWMAFYPSLRSYVTETQGVPEGIDPARPPFQKARELVASFLSEPMAH